METQTPRFLRVLPYAGLAMLAVLITLFGWRSFGGALPLQAQGYRINVVLPDALNMETGADATIAGVHVGDVVRVQREGFRPVATVEIKPKYVPLRVGAKAIPRTKSLLGEAYIEFTPGAPGAALIPDHGRLPSSSVTSAQSLDDVLAAFTPKARRDFRRVVGGLAGALHGRAADLSADVAQTGPLLADTAAISEVLSRQQTDLQRLISASGDVFSAVGERDGAVRLAVRAGEQVLATTAQRRRALAATVHAMPAFLHSVVAVSTQLTAASGDLDQAVGALAPVTPKLEPALGQLERTAPVLSTTFQELVPTMAAAQRGLPALTRVIRAVRTPLAQAHQSLREVIPVLQLAAQIRHSIVAFFANFASLANGRVKTADGYLGATGSAVPSVWNETVAGWAKKLPSSRYNPYPKPDSARDIERGALKSYDCRHLGNTLYLAPTGGKGAPPCLTQGPWTFNGRTAYYPRLQPSPP